jgi:hypothetical protein
VDVSKDELIMEIELLHGSFDQTTEVGGVMHLTEDLGTTAPANQLYPLNHSDDAKSSIVLKSSWIMVWYRGIYICTRYGIV